MHILRTPINITKFIVSEKPYNIILLIFLLGELEKKTQELATEMEAHKVTKDQMEKARRDVKKKSVLSLEMEDYERSMKELTTKMEENKKKMVQVRT